MFPASEVRNESGKTIKTRWNNLEAQEVIFDIYPDGLEEQARLHLIEKHALGKWADFSGEIPNEFKTIKQIEVIERKYIKEIYKRKKHKLKAYQAAQFKDKDLILMARIPVPFSNSQSAHSAILVF